jgi:cell division protein FtsB
MPPTEDPDAPRARAGGSRGGRRAPHLTSRAAILAVVMCAIALSLAYPVREYVAQRREIAALRQQERDNAQQVNDLAQQQRRLSDKSYIEREARRRLNYCLPDEKCWFILDGTGGNGGQTQQTTSRRVPPWYVTLWQSVEVADKGR